MATSTTTSTTVSAQAAFATIDLSGYDAEQSRLMDERCIVVDEQDRPIGALDKKTCTCERTHSRDQSD
jgi:isopentenyl-diphosphate delta-isomerase